MTTEGAVLDSSAILAWIFAEPGADLVRSVIASSHVSAVNHAEVVGRLAEAGWGDDDIHGFLKEAAYRIVAFDAGQAFAAGLLKQRTSKLGLSLGDRACLGLAALLGAPVYTGDRIWSRLDVDLEIRLVR
ncbi:type II toxin-antitoxin system VapC family toxin [Prosthecodimorpha staleyi]|uniref:Type II toxin-antitoxin system VapC family toxin n=1 Tax=Prosthecodimorpha staleyi TaxID=2840188 RepID=A0A947D6D5_9HYPH|nr:type II toxin-antitoxin system VapC family toxin [Prosthecodimorpha staleyi]MBT9289032.1 type II toxin-antitoxin system VapC family toxin [Prosthecodimorpha staleyi]